MRSKRTAFLLFSITVVLSLIAAQCGAPATEAPPAETEAPMVEETEAPPAETEEPMVEVPEEAVVGYDLDLDRRRGFTVTESGIVVIAKGEPAATFTRT